MCNRHCYWNMDGCCVSESLDEIGGDATFTTDKCIGFLREDMEEHMIEMKSWLLAFCPDNALGDEVAEYVKNMSYVNTLKMYDDVFGNRI